MIIKLGDFDQNTLENFIKNINDLKDSEELIVVIDSEGGNCIDGHLYQYILERQSTFRHVELIGLIMNSAAFSLFYNTRVHKKVFPGSYGMVHSIAWSISLGNNLIPRGDFEKFKLEVQKKQKDDFDFLTNDERVQFNNGENIYLDYDRIKLIIDKL